MKQIFLQLFLLRAGDLLMQFASARLHDLEELTLKMRKKCQAHEELQRCCVPGECLIVIN